MEFTFKGQKRDIKQPSEMNTCLQCCGERESQRGWRGSCHLNPVVREKQKPGLQVTDDLPGRQHRTYECRYIPDNMWDLPT